MEHGNPERQLVAIVAIDVAGYSRLMGADEEGTFAALKAHREAMRPLIDDHGGRLVGQAGDGFLLEFNSVLDALKCTLRIQTAMATRNTNVADERKMLFRAGINLGDVLVDGDDIFGDGVNVAARIEQLAPPGGICISRTVRDQLRDRTDVKLEDMGKIAVKNIARPIRVFRVMKDGEAAPQAPENRAGRWKYAALLAVIFGLAIAGAGLLWLTRPDISPADPGRMTYRVPDKPSIAVLPFTDMSGGTDHAYFSDGMSEDIITDLSKISSLFVISRNSSFVYKGAAVNIATVAEQLGVRYVLEGSVRVIGDQVRINAQLIDAGTGGHIWADRYDGALANVFDLQDKVTAHIVSALALNLTKQERELLEGVNTRNIDARSAFQKGWEFYRHASPKKNALALKYFKQALKIDPDYGRAHAASAMAYIKGCGWGWAPELGISGGQSETLAQDHLSKIDLNKVPLGNVAASQFQLFMNRQHEGQIAASRAVALDPNDAEGHLAMAWAQITDGRPADGLLSARRALRLDPRHRNYYAFVLGTAHFALGDLEKAAEILEPAWLSNPASQQLTTTLAASYAHLGLREKARNVLGRYAEDMKALSILTTNSLPYKWDAAHSHVVQRLRAGVDLAALPLTVTVNSLIEDLRHDQNADRRDIVRQIGWFGPRAKPAVPALVLALADKNRFVRMEVIRTLSRIGPPAVAATAALKQALRDPELKDLALNALEMIARQ